MNKTVFMSLIVSIVCILSVSNVRSEEAVKSDQETKALEELRPGSGEVFMNIGEVVIRDRKDAIRNVDLPGSVDVLGWDEVKHENLDNSLELLRKIPGITIGDYGNGGVPNGFTLRGYDSNSHGNHTVVTIDGIPINSHLGSADGAPDLNQLTPEEVDRLELIKGPIDARYGNWSRGGVLHLHTRTRGDFQKAKVSYGSWDHKKAYASLGTEHFDGKFNQVYSLEYYTAEGWRDDADRERQNAYAKWYYRPSDELQIGLHTHVYDADWETAGYLPESYWKQNPRQSIPTSEDDGGYKDLTEGSLHLDWNIASDKVLTAKAWGIHDTYARYADWGGGQTESYFDNETYGFLSNFGWDLEPAPEQALRLDVGFDYRSFESHGENWNTTARRRDSLVAGSSNNGDFDFINYGTYLKANYDPFKVLRLFAGIRHDWFTGETTNWETGVQRDMKDYDVTTYKGGLIVTPVEKYSFYANAATTFALPSGTAKYAENAPDERDYFFWEIGLKGEPWDWLLFRYAYFDQEEDGLALVNGEWVSQGDARRKGHEFEVNAIPWHSLELFTSYTIYDAEYETGPNEGKELAHIPEYIWKLGAQYTLPWESTQIRAWYNDVGEWYTNATNDNSYEGYETLDVKVIQSLGKKWTVSFDVKNLTDETYSEFVSYWSGENQYAGSNARSYYVTVMYDF
jgi:iron complex outermembrane recepter protein